MSKKFCASPQPRRDYVLKHKPLVFFCFTHDHAAQPAAHRISHKCARVCEVAHIAAISRPSFAGEVRRRAVRRGDSAPDRGIAARRRTIVQQMGLHPAVANMRAGARFTKMEMK